MSRATRPKGVRAYACLRFPTPGFQRRHGAIRVAGWAVDGMRIMATDLQQDLFGLFAAAINADLAAAGSDLRISLTPPSQPRSMTLIDRAGPVGDLPDHADVAIILAVGALLSGRSQPRSAQPRGSVMVMEEIAANGGDMRA